MSWTCLTPIPLVANEILVQIKNLYPDISFKFDPTLTYEESIRGVRAMRSAFDVTKEQVFPLLTYSMTVLKPYTYKRHQYPMKKDLTDPQHPIAHEYKSRHCAFDINWKIYYSDIIGMKTFEVMFSTETSFNLVQNVTLNMNEIGHFEYQVVWDWEGLAGNAYNKQDNLYMSCDGVAKVFGEFVMAKNVDSRLIAQINLQVGDFVNHNMIWDRAKITAAGTEWLP
jgi:hypothetical protein